MVTFTEDGKLHFLCSGCLLILSICLPNFQGNFEVICYSLYQFLSDHLKKKLNFPPRSSV